MASTGHEIAEASGFNNFDYRLAGDVRDPHGELAEARRTTPVLRLAGLDGLSQDTFIVFRFREVAQVLRDGQAFSSSIQTETMGDYMGKKIILGMDEPEHHRHRALVSPSFRQSAMARWEESLVVAVVNELIDLFVDRGRAELVYEFTFPFPTKVVAGVLGLPAEDYLDFQRWAVAINTAEADRDRGRAASRQLTDYLARVVEERRRSPGDDLISELVQTEFEGEKLDEEEIFSFLRLLLPAGVETTFRSSGNLLFLLLSHPDQLEAVRADRSLLPQAIEEALRLEPPLTITARVAATDTELDGAPIPKGSRMITMLGSANRDPDQYPEPDRFDIFRDPHQHISFGTGPHMCLGIHLARMETRVAVEVLLDRLPGLRFDPVAFDRDDPHIHGQIFRSPTSLPVMWDA